MTRKKNRFRQVGTGSKSLMVTTGSQTPGRAVTPAQQQVGKEANKLALMIAADSDLHRYAVSESLEVMQYIAASYREFLAKCDALRAEDGLSPDTQILYEEWLEVFSEKAGITSQAFGFSIAHKNAETVNRSLYYDDEEFEGKRGFWQRVFGG